MIFSQSFFFNTASYYYLVIKIKNKARYYYNGNIELLWYIDFDDDGYKLGKQFKKENVLLSQKKRKKKKKKKKKENVHVQTVQDTDTNSLIWT